MDENTLTRLVEGLLGVLVAVGAWVWTRAINDLSELDDRTQKNEVELERFKTHVSDHYAKEGTVRESLARVHDRIDDVGRTMETGFREMRDDFKHFLGDKKRNEH